MKIKVNYIKRWGDNGTCYTQTIKIDNDLKNLYNDYLKRLQNDIANDFKKTHVYSNMDIKILSLEPLQTIVNYTNLIHLGLFLELINELNLRGYNIDFKRIKYRNTIIEVI